MIPARDPGRRPPLGRMLLALALVGALFVALILREPPPKAHVIEVAGAAWSTRYDVKVSTDAAPTPEQRQAVADLVARELAFVGDHMSRHQADSEISRLNGAPVGETFALSPETGRVLAMALDVNARSGGAFDVTVGPLVRVWGFYDDGRAEPPSDEELANARTRVGAAHVQLDERAGSVRKLRDGVEVDLSAIAKGYGVDRIALGLEALGHHDYLVDIGGEVRAAGHNPLGAAWRIGIATPGRRGGPPARILAIEGAALATSGDYERFYLLGDRRVTHVIDPRDGQPVGDELGSVTVVASECALADAWATALLVLGPVHGPPVAEREHLAAFFLVRQDDGTFAEQMTSAFRERFPRTVGNSP